MHRKRLWARKISSTTLLYNLTVIPRVRENEINNCYESAFELEAIKFRGAVMTLMIINQGSMTGCSTLVFTCWHYEKTIIILFQKQFYLQYTGNKLGKNSIFNIDKYASSGTRALWLSNMMNFTFEIAANGTISH